MPEFSPNNTRPTAEKAESTEALTFPKATLELGQHITTPGARAALVRANASPADLLARHEKGDWGDMDAEDLATNDRAAANGGRLLSSYNLPITGEPVWVITEADRSATTILLPEEY